MEFDRYAKNYDDGLMGKFSCRFYRDLIEELNVRNGDSILDVGCGTGTVLNYITKQNSIHGYGIDVSEPMLEVARNKGTGCTFITGDAADLPFEDCSVDTVTACMSYHHLPDQEGFRREAMRILKSGGHLYICDPRFPAFIRGIFNTFFEDAGFHSVSDNISDFTADGFTEENTVKDLYVQVLHFRKP